LTFQISRMLKRNISEMNCMNLNIVLFWIRKVQVELSAKDKNHEQLYS
jgi:hypothetical protein